MATSAAPDKNRDEATEQADYGLCRVRERNQVTLPKELVRALQVEKGDYLRVVVSSDNELQINLQLVDVVPRAGSAEADAALALADEEVEEGSSVSYASKAELRKALTKAAAKGRKRAQK